MSAAKDVEQTERDLKRLFPKSKWNAVHLQIIYFGREYCPARYRDLTTCPICSWASTRSAKPRRRAATLSCVVEPKDLPLSEVEQIERTVGALGERGDQPPKLSDQRQLAHRSDLSGQGN